MKKTFSKKKKLYGGTIENVCKQITIDVRQTANLYDAIEKFLNNKIVDGKITSIPENEDNISKIKKFLEELKPFVFFNDIAKIVETYSNEDVGYRNFQTKLYKDQTEDYYRDLFSKYELFTKEDKRTFITIDPTIIQIMKFEDDTSKVTNNDIVYSLKLIIREQNKLTIRYTTELFPDNSKIIDFSNLTGFDDFNLKLDLEYKQEKLNNIKKTDG